MNTTQAKVKDYFEITARDFDSLYDDNIRERLLNRLFRRGVYDRVNLTLQAMHPLNGETILDVGCGSGRNSALFAKSGASKVLGLDCAGNMLDLARSYAKETGLEQKLEFVQGEFMAYQNSEIFDYSVALGVFDYIETPAPFLQKMGSMTKKKVIASFPGKSAFREPFRQFRYRLRGCPLFFYSKTRLEELFANAGFEKYEVIPYSSSGFMGIGYPSN